MASRHANDTIWSYLSNGNGTYALQQGFATSPAEFDIDALWAGDVDGDGRTDLINHQNNYLWTYFSNGDGSYVKKSYGSI